MSKFIKINATDNQGIIVNLNNVVKICKVPTGVDIHLIDSTMIRSPNKFDDLERLLTNNTMIVK